MLGNAQALHCRDRPQGQLAGHRLSVGRLCEHMSADKCLLTLQGLAKNIGVSNMSIKKMQDVLKYAKVWPKTHEEQVLSASLYWRRGCR